MTVDEAVAHSLSLRKNSGKRSLVQVLVAANDRFSRSAARDLGSSGKL